MIGNGNDVENKVDVLDGYNDVPAADSVDNVVMRDVIGNKTDTVIGNSLVSQAKIVNAAQVVPAADSVDNVVMRDVIGNKTDTHSASSIYGHSKIIEEHLHGKVFLNPEKSASILLQKLAGVWAAYPTPTQIISAGLIPLDFDLHFMNVSAISANGEYTIALYIGAALAEVKIGAFGAARNAVQSQEGSRNIMTQLIPANTRVSAAISSENVGQDTLRIKVEGHTY